MLASLVLFVLLAPGTAMSYPEFLAVYLLAQLAGLVSQVPGGLGVFETRDRADAVRQVAGESNLRCPAGISRLVLLAAAEHRRAIARAAGDFAQTGAAGCLRSAF